VTARPGSARVASERVVIFRIDKIGDLLVSSPIFRAIRQCLPDAHVTLVASPANAFVLRGLPEIDDIVVYDELAGMAARIAGMAGLLRHLRALRPTTTIVLSPRNTAYFLAFASGARRRGGILMSYRLLPRLLAPWLLTAHELIDRRADRPRRHHTATVLALAVRMGFEAAGPARLLVPHDEAALRKVRTILAHQPHAAPRIVIQLAAKSDAGLLSGSGVIALARAISCRYPGAGIVVTGGAAETAGLERLARDFDLLLARAPDVCGSRATLPGALLVTRLGFAEWSALLGAADLVVTPDCGAVHVAAAQGRKLVVLYAAERMARALAEYGPWRVPFRAIAQSAEYRGGAGPDDAEATIAGIIAAMAELMPERRIVPEKDAVLAPI
jgi:ADP-heptose:LPS heptosyltransferase